MPFDSARSEQPTCKVCHLVYNGWCRHPMVAALNELARQQMGPPPEDSKYEMRTYDTGFVLGGACDRT